MDSFHVVAERVIGTVTLAQGGKQSAVAAAMGYVATDVARLAEENRDDWECDYHFPGPDGIIRVSVSENAPSLLDER